MVLIPLPPFRIFSLFCFLFLFHPLFRSYSLFTFHLFFFFPFFPIVLSYPSFISLSVHIFPHGSHINRLTPNDPYMGRTAPLTSKRCILYIYSTNIGTEYFKHAINSPLFSLQNAVCFIMLTCLVPVLFTFYIQSMLKLKKK